MKKIREVLRWLGAVLLSPFHLPHLLFYWLGGAKSALIKTSKDINNTSIMGSAPTDYMYCTY